MTLLAITETSDPHAFGWTELAAQSAWPGAWAILAALLIGGVYCAVLVRGKEEKRPRMGYFALGLAVWIAALSGPLERLALNRLYSAYILQQILLVMVVCPALLAGIEGWMLRPALSKPPMRQIWGFLTRPGVAFLIFVTVFTVIHIPSICNELCHVRPFYHTVRISLFLAGLLLWWPLLSPMPEFPRLSQPVQGLYLMGLMLSMSAVAAPITFAETVLYHFYMSEPHPLGFSAVVDQEIGGLLMWVVQGLILTVVASVIFVRWLSGPER
ncbi:MAG TPA: cytochrome c oxidase assembly protein, partial [Candidatus Acidoferrales bacterium]|nr:cytochrome c oxidase assembly protein [Candidatus Acidoferrales bacterium]